MALIKRKQIDLYIKTPVGNVSGNVFGIDNLAGIAAGAYAITAGDQYEIVVDKIVGAIDDIADQIDGLYFTYLVNGASSKNLTKQATIDLKSTANQVSVAKNDLTNGVEYTFSLPSSVIAPGSLKVTTTTELAGNVTLSGNSQTITHTGTGNLTISSTNGEVYIEGSHFAGNNATIPGDLTVSGNFNVVGNITQTAVNDVIVQDRFIKLANGNTGAVTVTGLYQQTGTSTYSGLIYNSTEGQFRLFTSTIEPTTSTNMSALTSANLKIYGLDANNVEFISMGSNAKEAVQDLISTTLTEGYGINLAYTDAGAPGTGTLAIAVDINEIASSFNLQVKTYEDSSTPNQYGINLLSESLVFSDSDTALVKKVTGVEALKVIIRATIHEDIVYNVAGGAGKFTLDGSGNAVITLSYNVSPGEFKDILANNEYVQVFINGVKCKYYECQWTAGSATVKVYAGSNTSGNYTGVGFPLETNDVFTVLYYGDKTNEVANPAVTTTTTVAPTTTTTTSPITTAAPVYTTYEAQTDGNISAIDSYGDTIIVGTSEGTVWRSDDGGTTWNAAAVIPGSSPINSINLLQGFWIASSAIGLAWSTGAGWEVATGLSFVPTAALFYAAGSFLAGTTDGRILRSTDNGINWGNSLNLGENSPIAKIAIERSSGNHLIAVCNNKVAYTNTYGQEWSTIHTATDLPVGETFTSASITLTAGRIAAVASSGSRINYCANIVVAPTTWTQNTINGTVLPIKASAIKTDGLIIMVDGSTDAYKISSDTLATSGAYSVQLDANLTHAGDSIGAFDANIVIGGQTGVSKRNS